MSLTALVGFDSWTVNSVQPTWVTGMATSPLMGTVVPGQNIPLNNLAGLYDSGTQCIRSYALANGTSRNYFCSRLTGLNSYNRIQYTYGNSLSLIPKTGKWYFGMRCMWTNFTGSAPPAVATIRLGTAAAWAVALPSGSTAGAYYFELVVDWVNLTITAYINGVQVAQMSGSTYVTATYASMYMYLGPHTSLSNSTSNSWYMGYTDVYFIVEEAGETNPISGRLGPILVKPQPIAAMANAGRFTPPANATVLDTLNANNTTLGSPVDTYSMNATNRVIATDPHGDIAEATFAAPNETAAIKAVHLQVLTYKTQNAAAGTTLQLKQGSVSKDAIKTVPGLVSAPLVQNFGFTKAFDGTDWTAEKVGQIKIDVGSYRP